MPRNIQEIDKAIEQLKAQRQQAVAKQVELKRASETRRKTIIGGWLMANEPATVERIVQSLTRLQDRRAFGLDDELGEAPAIPPIQ